MLSKPEIMRYVRQIILDGFHSEGQLALKQAKVLVIGAGGLGCPVLQYLTAAGIGRLGIVDFDVVEISNLHRQVLYTAEEAGQKKAVVAAKKLSLQNPFVVFDCYPEKIGAENAASIVEAYDMVVDGSDNFATRYLVNDACVAAGKLLIYGSILGYQGQLALFNYKGSRHLRHLFPDPPSPDEVPDCSTNGVLGTVPGIVGTLMAQTVIRVLLGDELLKNKLMLIDTITMERELLEYGEDH